jgi:hypothetical protein
MNQLSLSGIDGQHLWGFLTALGTLALLDQHARKCGLATPRLAFKEDGTAILESPVSNEQLAAVLLARLKDSQPYLGGCLRDIKKPSDFTRSNFEAIALAIVTTIGRRPPKSYAARRSICAVDFLAGLACVVGEEPCESTLCAANGASHQNLVQSMRDVLDLVEEEHVRSALFEAWRRSYRIPDNKRKELKLGTRKPTLRLDPSDERLYAMRLSNPTTTDDFSTELGAQALAIPAFGLLPIVPSNQPVTVASRRSRQRVTFSWPLWNIPSTLHTIRSLVWMGVGNASELRERGVFAAFSADRVSGAKGKLSFAPSEGVW